MTPQRRLLHAMFDAAVQSALPHHCLPPHLPAPPRGRTIVVGAGKAAASMAQAVEDNWPGDIQGVVVTRYGHAAPCRRIRVLEAAHPVPDQAGIDAARAILDAVAGLTADDLVICLISGGGSALLPALPASISLEDEQALARTLLRSGAAITEMNCVRRHVSLIKGGRLAAAARPARVETLIISDVPGDDPAAIASGPTVADPSTRGDALAVIDKYALDIPWSIRAWLENPDCETPKPGELANSRHKVIATAQSALTAAAAVAADAGYTPLILGDAIEGEASTVGLVHAGITRQVLAHGQPVPAPCVLLSGGETTVTVRGQGRGGRNVEFLLGLLTGLPDVARITAIAADTDGIDGTQDNAGAMIDSTTRTSTTALPFPPDTYLRRNDAYSFFEATGDLVRTGATHTNVNDFRAILIEARSPIVEFHPP
ncbi:glycerate kinase type-2 family protein [Niveispirillum fermenti]|uniref:glycerate kinase type-2 family protein n=1 Tax=Niveispirillum fermenti TaxID=1233113 RepID=UPI003A8C740F